MTVFLYAGQGSQLVGMGKDFYEKFPEYRSTVEDLGLDFDYLKLMHEGDEDVLRDTRYTQPCMAVFAAGVTEVLKNKGIVPDAAAGLSLGEYSALYAAGVWDRNTFLDIVNFRGKAMAKAAQGMDVSMSAIIGLEPAVVEEACQKCSSAGFVTIANYNCPGQYVICGEESAVTATEEYLKENFKARCTRIKTSGPFHTKLLKQAGDDLQGYFDNIEFNKPAIPVANNYTGKLYDGADDLKNLLVMQVCNSVRFEECLKALISAGADRFIEIGPGKVLSGLLKKTTRALGTKVESYVVQNVEDVDKLLEALA